jgi:flagellar basal body rod protein FlgG
MIYGLYLSGQGAETQAMRQAVLSNNLANAGTTGFKPDIPVFRAHFPFDVAEQSPFVTPDTHELQTGGVDLAATITDFAQGPLRVTGGKLDVAVVGPGFLQVGDEKQVLLTRDGRLALDADRQLVTADGNLPVLGNDQQPISIPAEVAAVEISAEGILSGMTPGGAVIPIGQLGLVEPDEGVGLVKRGEGHYVPQGDTRPAAQAHVRQGVLEDSAVQPVASMVELIETSRSFEMNMSLLRYQDEMVGQLLQRVARR